MDLSTVSTKNFNILEIIYAIFIGPLELVTELFYTFSFKVFNNIGFSVIFLSFFITILTLPLYNMAESLQNKDRLQRLKLKKGIDRIKATFTGDERYMILSTYYKQNNYHPIFFLRSSLNLLIQVPFFIAAYNFLSKLPLLEGERFLFINNLGIADNLFQTQWGNINVLPIVMTLINLISTLIYTKGFLFKDKIQLFGISSLFFVLLYNAPAGLVIYWTFNNILSLIKISMKNFNLPNKLLYYGYVFLNIIFLITVIILNSNMTSKKRLLVVLFSLFAIFLPQIYRFTIQSLSNSSIFKDKKSVKDFYFYLLLLIFLWLMMGIVVPLNLISSSPIEFSNIYNIKNPLGHLIYPLFVMVGLIIIWPLLIYSISNDFYKKLLILFFLFLTISNLINVLIFKGNYGIVSYSLKFDEPSLLDSDILMSILPILSVVIIFIFIIKVYRYKNDIIITALILLVVSSFINGSFNLLKINRAYLNHVENLDGNDSKMAAQGTINPIISLSKNKNNVVMLFIDKAVNSYFPIIIEQFPYLKKQFSGFVYYPNTISFGAYTISGSPAMMGGYEYTPEKINERSNTKLVEKHNESILLLPTLFKQANFDVSVFDPPLSNYKWSDDFSIFKQLQDVQVYRTMGRYNDTFKRENKNIFDPEVFNDNSSIRRKIIMFSLLKSTFPILRNILYDDGKYFLILESEGYEKDLEVFIDSYAVLHYLPLLTEIGSNNDTYTFLGNDLPHRPFYLEAPSYNLNYLVENKFTPLDSDPDYEENDKKYYHSNVATFLKIGTWLEYLRSEGVYDNTRIIIVSDHGNNVNTPAFKNFINKGKLNAHYNPILLIKDFNDDGEIVTDLSFMTNADAPIFAIKDIIENPVNPFTGNNLFTEVEKTSATVYMIPWQPAKNEGTQFKINLNESFRVKNNIFLESNWETVK